MKTITRIVCVVALLCALSASAMREVGGKDKLNSDTSWPDGVLAVANLASRFMYSSGDGGDCEFLYRGDIAAFHQALAALAEVRAPAVELYVHDAPHLHWIAKSKGDDGRIDWSFTVWNHEQWHQMYNSPNPGWQSYHKPVAAPRMDVYVRTAASPGGIDWTAVKVPEKVTVIDQRESAQKVKTVGGAMIRGTIYDMASGKTIAAVKINVQALVDKEWESVCEGRSDDKGLFEVDKIPAGSYRVLASAFGYAPRVLLYSSFTATTFTPIDGELSAEVTVKGTITNDHDKPLANVKVGIESALGIDGRVYSLPETLEATSDAAGRFSLANVPTGFAVFDCTAKGLVQLDARMLHKLASGKAITPDGRAIRETGQTPADLRMAAPGTIHCKVISPDGRPLKTDLYVTVADARGSYSHGRDRRPSSVPIKPDGSADFSDVTPGRYYVVTGYQVDMYPDPTIITVTAGKTTEVEITAR